MKRIPSMLVVGAALLAAGGSARAVYAPIPDVEQGRLLTVYLGAGYYYDTNLFGAAEDGIESMVFQAKPTIVANMPFSDQSFLSASYQLSLDYFNNRPGAHLLAGHSLGARLAHTFTQRLEGEINESFQITRNPESLLPGAGGGGVVNPDQSSTFNQIDGKMLYSASSRVALRGKVRARNIAYDNEYLRHALDHGEYLAGVEVVRASRENLRVSAEYRWQAFRYRHEGALKDKDSHILFAGADYAPTKRTACSSRLGVETLLRRDGENTALPYAELGAKHDYSEGGFVSAGYAFARQESSNAYLYPDMLTHHFFVNAQHALGRALAVSLTADWQPARLKGRKGVADGIGETNLKLGGALTYSSGQKWSVSLTLDYDHVRSDDPGRNLERMRTGVHGRWVF